VFLLWVENVGNGVGPLHRKVDRNNPGASKGPKSQEIPKVLRPVESGLLAESPGTLINSVISPAELMTS
jgi:hypothetical protein